MAAPVSGQLLRRLALSSAASQRCGCSMSAGPSVVRRAQKELRGLHSSSRALQDISDIHIGFSTERDTGSMSRRQKQATMPTQASSTSSRHHQARQASDLASIKQEILDVEDGSSTIPATADAKPASTLPSYSFARPKQHPMTEGRLVCTLHLSSYSDDLENLTFFTQFCVHAAYAFGLPCSLPSFLPTKSSLRTVPRSPFVHKPSQENFVKKEHKRMLKIHDADLSAVGQWIDYISENSMSGVRMKATTWENLPLGYGQQMISDSQDLEPSEGQKVKELAESLLASGFGEESATATGKEKGAGDSVNAAAAATETPEASQVDSSKS